MIAAKSSICKQRHLYGSNEPKAKCNRDLSKCARTSTCFMVSQHAVAGLGTKEECRVCLVAGPPSPSPMKSSNKNQGASACRPHPAGQSGPSLPQPNLGVDRAAPGGPRYKGASFMGEMGAILRKQEEQMAICHSSFWIVFAYQRFNHPKSEAAPPKQ